MATTTTNLGLKKPASTDKVSIDDINANMDIIDTIVDMIPEVDDALDGTSSNPLQNKVVNQAIYQQSVNLGVEINKKQNKITASTSEPTSSEGADGDFWAVYEE